MPIEILMPALSPTMEEGTLSKWTVKEGDTVSSGDVIAEIETDKATMEVEAVDEGVMGKILVEEGSEGVKVNAPIGLLLEDGEDKSALDGYTPKGAEGGTSDDTDSKASDDKPKSEDTASESKSEAASQSKSEAPASGSYEGERIKASPLARRMAKDAGLDLKALDGSGPKGRIVKRDIEEAKETGVGKAEDKAAAKSEAPKSQPSKPVDEHEPLAQYGISADRYEIKKADNITKISAKRLSESFRDIPHFPLNVDCRLDALLKFRKDINAKTPEGVKVSVNDILIKASGLALKKVPQANASWIEDGRIALHKHADVSVAVAIEGGLITPIIKDADQKGLAQISAEMKDLAARARDRKLKPEEYQGGTFSLSNLGMFGIASFSSIINPPQGMILSVGAGEERPVITDGALAKATVMTVTLTCDHRVVDGANGARWLSAFKGFIEDPMTMLM
ncbi:pyruvate dehydrogenase complex dihydrolipoamide acetyltransferase [Oceanicaulis sp.]|uniref:pyruvate dehydrogenase complex dihydrolipoamide acetyltransferase n=1 Tax=Oceanicaulis sp. TaxID=1924941 RepID=UPI003BACC9B6